MLTSKAASIMQPSFYIRGLMLPRPPIVFVIIAAPVVSYLPPQELRWRPVIRKRAGRKPLSARPAMGWVAFRNYPRVPTLVVRSKSNL